MEYEPLTIELAAVEIPGTRVISLQGPLTINNLFAFPRRTAQWLVAGDDSGNAGRALHGLSRYGSDYQFLCYVS